MFSLDLHSAYFFFSSCFLAVWVVVYFISPATRMRQLRTSSLRMFGGPLVEILYFQDYWNPESILSFSLGPFRILLEDFMFGFAFSGVASVLYQIVFRRTMVEAGPVHAKRTFYRDVVGILLVCGLLFFWGVNSIYVTAIGFCLATLSIVCRRPDLAIPSFLNGFLVFGFVFCAYLVGFYSVTNSEEVLRTWWFLYQDSALGHRFLGLPITELVWAFAYGTLAGSLFAFRRDLRYA